MLKGKVILVTGASGGIGSETARLLAENGATVILNYSKSRARAEAVAKKIREEFGVNAIAVKADVSSLPEVDKMVREIIRRFKKIDAVVNNASAPIEHKAIEELEWKCFQGHIDVTLRGAFNVIKSVAPHMAEKKSGKIINILSSYTLGAPPSKLSFYTSAKFALLGLSKSLAVELGPRGITINCVSPGMTETEMLEGVPPKLKEIVAYQTPLKRIARPLDVARAVLFLCSENSDYLTGTNIPVCGGNAM